METLYILFVSKVYLDYFCIMNDELLSILRKVRTLYRKYGIRSVTMDDISHELGISKKTLYQYVRDKDDLVRQFVEMEMNDHDNRMNISCTEDNNAIEQLLEISRCISILLKDHSMAAEYDLKKYYPDLYSKVRDLKRNHMLKFILSNLIKGKEEGIYRKEMNVEIIAKLNVSIIDNIFDNEVITISEFLDTRFFYEFFVYHIRGIANATGLQLLDEQLDKYEFPK